jgi:hypothetical protein
VNNTLSKQLDPLRDDFLENIKHRWFNESHPVVKNSEFIPLLNEWFQSTKVNNLTGWHALGCIDVTMGCTHYIESFVLRHGWDGFQLLTDEYAYYSFMGKWGVAAGNLEPNKPLIMTIPHYRWGGMRPEWNDILRECEQKNIDIHLDMAWVTLSRNVEIDFSHPNIRSVGMSMTKYGLGWNRVGLRYSKQRTMDSITMFNHYYQPDTNVALSSCGAFCVDQISRDYGWNTYGQKYSKLCVDHAVNETSFIHVVQTPQGQSLGCTRLLTNFTPHREQ